MWYRSGRINPLAASLLSWQDGWQSRLGAYLSLWFPAGIVPVWRAPGQWGATSKLERNPSFSFLRKLVTFYFSTWHPEAAMFFRRCLWFNAHGLAVASQPRENHKQCWGWHSSKRQAVKRWHDCFLASTPLPLKKAKGCLTVTLHMIARVFVAGKFKTALAPMLPWDFKGFLIRWQGPYTNA